MEDLGFSFDNIKIVGNMYAISTTFFHGSYFGNPPPRHQYILSKEQCKWTLSLLYYCIMLWGIRGIEMSGVFHLLLLGFKFIIRSNIYYLAWSIFACNIYFNTWVCGLRVAEYDCPHLKIGVQPSFQAWNSSMKWWHNLVRQPHEGLTPHNCYLWPVANVWSYMLLQPGWQQHVNIYFNTWVCGLWAAGYDCPNLK